MEWEGKQRICLWQVLFKEKKEVRKHKIENVKWNGEFFLQVGTTHPKSISKKKLLQGAKEIEEEGPLKAKALRKDF